MITKEQLEGVQKITWCTGCGNHGILVALRDTILELGYPQHEYLLVSGIGCGSKIPHYINLNGIHTLHGRSIPVAQGAHLVNLDLKVLVHVGDGDTLGEGLGHLMHAARRNVNISVFIHNNGVMGLTKGQFSPSARRGYVSNTSPPTVGAPMNPVNTVALALAGGATFVARGFSGDRKSLISLMTQAVKHEGFAVVDILQPCQTWNRELTWKFYNEHTYSLQESDHDFANKQLALEKAFSNSEKIPTGVFYKIKAPVLSESLAIPQDSQLKEHETNAKDVQAIIDRLLIP